MESQDWFYIDCYADDVIANAKKWMKDNRVDKTPAESAFWDVLIEKATEAKENKE